MISEDITGNKFHRYFRRHEHAFSGGEVNAYFFIVLACDEIAESGDCYRVKFGTTFTEYD